MEAPTKEVKENKKIKENKKKEEKKEKNLTLKHAFRYGDPIIVIVETLIQMKEDKMFSSAEEKELLSTKWWLAVLTTRLLLAHAIYSPDKDEMLIPLIANIRNVLRVLGVDISDKHTIADLQKNEKVMYRALDAKGKFYFHIRAIRTMRGDMQKELATTTFDDMKNELMRIMSTSEAVKRVFELFGRAVHELVSTRYSRWNAKTKQYQSVAPKTN